MSNLLNVVSAGCIYTDDKISASADYRWNEVTSSQESGINEMKVTVQPKSERLSFEVRVAPESEKTGLLLVGLGGNNGTTITASMIANRDKVEWRTRTGVNKADWLGSMLLTSSMKIGTDEGREYHVPIRNTVPLLNPEHQLVIGGWDISAMPLGDAMARAAVFEPELQDKLYGNMQEYQPMKGVYYPDFVADNQSYRADNVMTVEEGSTKHNHLEELRANIRAFKAVHKLENVIVLWVANTERYCQIETYHNSEAAFLEALCSNAPEIAPSQVYAMAAVLEGCSFINGAPQNTLCRAIVEAAEARDVLICGDDLKTGQTKLKSVMMEFLTGAGLKPESIVSYNHLGNNDGRNLSQNNTFQSKELSKSNVVTDSVQNSTLLYKKGEHPDHVVVIKYVPAVGDSKRAMDEYNTRIGMGGTNTIVVHNTCEDSLLAAPIMMDLVLLIEFLQRLSVYRSGVETCPSMSNLEHSEQSNHVKRNQCRYRLPASFPSYWLKAPHCPEGTPVINSLFTQREALLNLFRLCLGLHPESHVNMHYRVA